MKLWVLLTPAKLANAGSCKRNWRPGECDANGATPPDLHADCRRSSPFAAAAVVADSLE